MKGKSWDGGIRVPMIARWPKRIPAGRVCHAPAGVIARLFTMFNKLKAQVPDDLETKKRAKQKPPKQS